ncbi:hypothetical protein [Streptomyces sp. NPDC096152]|uniref:hypothetical protein n=1 Tax=Streptomyces sp. NPDC096152 TaxID=3366078 RepID=UPI00380D8AD0
MFLTITSHSNPFRALTVMTDFLYLSAAKTSAMYSNFFSGTVSYSSRGHFGSFNPS